MTPRPPSEETSISGEILPSARLFLLINRHSRVPPPRLPRLQDGRPSLARPGECNRSELTTRLPWPDVGISDKAVSPASPWWVDLTGTVCRWPLRNLINGTFSLPLSHSPFSDPLILPPPPKELNDATRSQAKKKRFG
jgi:hypothetical protein